MGLLDFFKSPPRVSVAATDFATIVADVVDVIVSTVQRSDCSEEYFSQKLPTSWDEPAIQPKSKRKELSLEEEDFLYSFHGKFHKERSFAIEMGKPTSSTLSNGKVRNIRVIWVVNDAHKNQIHVKYQDASEAGSWNEIILFKFFDSSADSRAPSYEGDNSIQSYLYNANPYEKPLKGASEDALARLRSKTDGFNRALYAVVQRKSMEWKPKKMGASRPIPDTSEESPPFDMPFPYEGGGWQSSYNADNTIHHFQRNCPFCDGAGKSGNQDCRYCQGTGWQRVGSDWKKWCV